MIRIATANWQGALKDGNGNMELAEAAKVACPISRVLTTVPEIALSATLLD